MTASGPRTGMVYAWRDLDPESNIFTEWRHSDRENISVAQDGEPFAEWDGLTYFEFDDGSSAPSKSDSEYVGVVGPGTNFPVGLSLPELGRLVYHWKKIQVDVSTFVRSQAYDTYDENGDPITETDVNDYSTYQNFDGEEAFGPGVCVQLDSQAFSSEEQTVYPDGDGNDPTDDNGRLAYFLGIFSSDESYYNSAEVIAEFIPGLLRQVGDLYYPYFVVYVDDVATVPPAFHYAGENIVTVGATAVLELGGETHTLPLYGSQYTPLSEGEYHPVFTGQAIVSAHNYFSWRGKFDETSGAPLSPSS